MERIVSKRDDFVVYALFYFKPVQRFDYELSVYDIGLLLGVELYSPGQNG